MNDERDAFDLWLRRCLRKQGGNLEPVPAEMLNLIAAAFLPQN